MSAPCMCCGRIPVDSGRCAACADALVRGGTPCGVHDCRCMQAMADDRESFMDIVRDEGERRRAEYGEPGLNPRQRREIQSMIDKAVDKAVNYFIKNVKTANGRIDRVADALIGVMESAGLVVEGDPRPSHPQHEDVNLVRRRKAIPFHLLPLIPRGPYGMDAERIRRRLEGAGIFPYGETPAGCLIHYVEGALHRRRGFGCAHSLPGPMDARERKSAELGFNDEDELMAAERNDDG